MELWQFDDHYDVCPECSEVLDKGMLRRHYMKDHDWEIAKISMSEDLTYLEVVELVAG